MRCGWSDPIGLLRLTGDDWRIAAAVVQKANDQHVEEMTRMAEAIGNRVAVAVSKLFK